MSALNTQDPHTWPTSRRAKNGTSDGFASSSKRDLKPLWKSLNQKQKLCRSNVIIASDSKPRKTDMPYKSRYPVRHLVSEYYKPGHIQYDSNWAASSATVGQAIERWNKYIKDHSQPEDGFSRNYLIGARIDLMRAYYLGGEVDKGDDILNQFDLTTLEYKSTDP